MGLPSMGGRPMGGAPGPQGAPPEGGQPGGDIRADLAQLQASIPPEFQSMLDPNNPITALTFKRLRDAISPEEGQALLNMFGNADALAIAGAKKVWPEIMILLDIFDDGEVNNSVGEGGVGMGEPMGFDGGAGGPPAGGPPRPGAPRPLDGADEPLEDEEDAPPQRSRLSSVMG